MKKKNRILLLTTFFITLLIFTSGCFFGKEEEQSRDELIVFNYGDYIDTDTISMFEKETGISVKYEEYVTPEDMYTKYKSGAIHYDLICTSDYMIEKLIKEKELYKIDTSMMKNYKNVEEKYLNLCETFDPGNKYCVPYFFGTVGILYNKKLVKEKVDSWSILWNKKYTNQIIMQNSMRDAFMVPLKWKGKSINTKDPQELLMAQKLLMKQKPIVEAYLVDEARDAMIAEDASMAVIYSGDATVAMEENENLSYVVPKEGSNVWFDCWAIPKKAAHKKAAEQFIDFMNRKKPAQMNFDYIYYGTPNTEVFRALDEETKEDETIFPPEEILKKCEVYQYLGEKTDQRYNRLFKELKSY
ncbi:MAG: ABC transporter substrate-binding protein [Eubacterium sp.]|nr:ABC transporter substrate-binding protein [Eubacterium sp.]MDD7209601.1 ABC transporter substrate-binding protein [Lachnospiraceae bacterium]MDY5497201.1 ABC transporter substrate-binding protein [Anaerobutyricum sp.]